jgi:hypothetical protein
MHGGLQPGRTAAQNYNVKFRLHHCSFHSCSIGKKTVRSGQGDLSAPCFTLAVFFTFADCTIPPENVL